MWLYENRIFLEEDIEDNVGFIYLIENTTTGKKYIGKKLFTRSKSFQKNKKKKTRRIQSDWLTYTGSNDMLNEHIDRGDTIKKTILHLCKSKGWLNYLETKEIFARDCLLNDVYYNDWVSVRVRRSHLKIVKPLKPNNKISS